MDAFAHCETVVREADNDRFLATLFAPAERRGALFALYAFNAEIALVRERIREPMAGEIRLQWWRDALERPGAGEVRANPVAAALLDTIVRYRLPVPALLDLIEARSFDLYDDPMATMAALEGYVGKTSSALVTLAAMILDSRRADISEAASSAGRAYGITGILRAFPRHAARGQLYVPVEVLDRHGASSADVFAGRATPELYAVLAELRGRARAHFDAFAKVAPSLPNSVAPAFLPLALVPGDLKRLDRSAPFALTDVPQWRRQWTLWRAARRA